MANARPPTLDPVGQRSEKRERNSSSSGVAFPGSVARHLSICLMRGEEEGQEEERAWVSIIEAKSLPKRPWSLFNSSGEATSWITQNPYSSNKARRWSPSPRSAILKESFSIIESSKKGKVCTLGSSTMLFVCYCVLLCCCCVVV